jgi:hypothetical protein
MAGVGQGNGISAAVVPVRLMSSFSHLLYGGPEQSTHVSW